MQATTLYARASTYIDDFSTRGPGTDNATGTPDLATFASYHRSGGGFEFDNVTLAGAVPGPAMWGMVIAGFGLDGGAMRRRTTGAVAA